MALLTNALTGVKGQAPHWTAQCPCHEDTEASLIIDVKPSKFWPHKITVLVFCPVCKSSLPDVCVAVGVAQHEVRSGNARATTPKRQYVEPLGDDKVETYVANLARRPGRLAYLLGERGLSTFTVEHYEIGWDNVRDRYVLPVREDGALVNLRRYLPGAKPGNKMRNSSGHGTPARLYPSLPPSGPVVVCEGEWDALVLRQHGFPAVTSTHGAATFLPEWVPRFASRHVAFLYDCDPAGRDNAHEHAAKVTTVARSVRVVDLDPSRTKPKGWDVSDWFSEGRSPDDLRVLINATPKVEVVR